MQRSKVILFWGAGATAELGIRTTKDQSKFLQRITGADAPNKSLQERVAEALSPHDTEPWRSALADLITILGDSDQSYDSIDFINDEILDAMRRNWRAGAGDDELRSRIIGLRLTYDWPALKSVVSICPGGSTDKFRLNDLFNVLDMHIPAGFGVHASTGHRLLGEARQYPEQFFDARRLIGAKNALLMILIALFYIDYYCMSKEKLDNYYDFAILLGKRMRRRGLELVAQDELSQPGFYQDDVGVVSLNYDPIALWLQFNAYRELNKSAGVPHAGWPAVPIHLFHDFGHLIPARRIGKPPADWPWVPAE